MHPWLRALQKHRRRIATLVVVVGVLVVGGRLFDAVPRDVHLRLRFGPDHAAVREAYVAYEQDGEEVVGARFHRPDETVDHELSLAPGRYAITATLRTEEGGRVIRRALRVPSDGVVHVDLYDRVMAHRIEPEARP
ncbi:MAG TPA: hypothetical protein RMH85_11800 [Polyangiaceae bacterium LLY-WYZ-15_(1-7)]|nr:hypothetical protein [Myxococcales bacterium]MAT28514.1 hypothetical protein [Sandaracinus sp.]HBP18538.1 hypothetical protein [Planctomycetota bacterium]HJK92450.1 hypothetical protein [Polyangiaceae bacterium LLY-WYZ-15_(1-7)]MBJ71643.1 hypothetical protein [Sandaracinus sp.]